jgi:flagellar biosynthetic protein FliR
MLAELIPAGLFAFLFVFARLGPVMMVMPGFGEIYVPPRVRLALALAMAAAMTPGLVGGLPALPAQPLMLVPLLFGEIAVGLIIGLTARLALTGLHVAGTVIAFQSGLGFAQFYDPGQGQQGALIATFLGLAGVTLIFATDMHLLVLQAAHDSYQVFPPAKPVPWTDFSDMATRMVAGSFKLGLQIAAPFMVYGLAFYTGLGLLSRIMPQLQVFFIAVPAQIILSLALLAIVFGAIAIWFIDYFEGSIAAFLVRV